jgi:tetratricopeptide (TPR) repeat protein
MNRIQLSTVVILAGALLLSSASCNKQADWDGLNDQAIEAMSEGRTDDAQEILADAIRLAREQGDRERLVGSLNTLARVQRDYGDRVEAMATFRQAYDVWAEGIEPDAPERAVRLTELAASYQTIGDLDESRALLEQTLEIWQARESDAEIGETLNNLGLIDLVQGHQPAAEGRFREAITIMERSMLLDDPKLAIAYTNLAQALRAQERYEEAEAWFDKAGLAWQRNAGPDSIHAALNKSDLAEVIGRQGRFDEAEALFLEAVETLAGEGAEHQDLAATQNNLALLYRRQKRNAEAETYYVQAIAVLEAAGSSLQPDLAATVFNLARLLEEDPERTDDAAENYERALALLELSPAADAAQLRVVAKHYAEFLERMGRPDEARAAESRGFPPE